MIDYRERHSAACKAAFEGFQPDFSAARDKTLAARILEMARCGWFSKEIADAVGKNPKSIQKFFRRYDFPSLHNIAPRQMEEVETWSGGTKLMKGYLYRKSPTHPNRTKHGGYVADHRLVLEEKLGRYLLKTEVADHIDGDISNNHPDNLRVFQSNAEHLHHTLSGRCPNWSEEGRSAIDHARSQPRRTWKGRTIQPSPSE